MNDVSKHDAQEATRKVYVGWERASLPAYSGGGRALPCPSAVSLADSLELAPRRSEAPAPLPTQTSLLPPRLVSAMSRTIDAMLFPGNAGRMDYAYLDKKVADGAR